MAGIKTITTHRDGITLNDLQVIQDNKKIMHLRISKYIYIFYLYQHFTEPEKSSDDN